MTGLARNPAAADAVRHLSPSQRDVLRTLDLYKAAHRAGPGWRLAGNFRKARTLKPLITLGLAEESFEHGRHRLMLTPRGREAAAMLRRR